MHALSSLVLSALPSDTGIPGLTRSRVWSHPAVRSHTLLILTLPRLYLAPLTGDPRPELAAAAEQHPDPGQLLGSLATVIDIAAVRRVRLNLIANELVIEYASPAGGTARVKVVLSTPEVADAVFSKLWRRLGPNFTLKPVEADSWAVVRGPLAALGGVVLAAAVLALGLNALDDAAAARRWDWAGSLPGWRPVCGLAGAAAAGITVWLYRRLTTPPERLDLAPE